MTGGVAACEVERRRSQSSADGSSAEPWLTDAAVDDIAEEVPVALVYNGISHVVMMATPLDLVDFGLGFSLTEGIAKSVSEIYGIEVNETKLGMEVHVELAAQRFAALKEQRRNLTGRTGCGLCGAESLQQAVRPPVPVLPNQVPDARVVARALDELPRWQPLQSRTGAVHGAAWCDFEGRIQLAREDVGRHNALDKLIGAMSATGIDETDGFAVVSSRASYELVNKCSVAGISTLVAVSAPTALAVEHARAASMNLIGFARSGRHVVYVDGYNQPCIKPEQSFES